MSLSPEELLLEAVGLAIPITGEWLRRRMAAGSTPEEAAADLEALFAAADATIDAAEDAKFGPREALTKP